MSVKKKKRTPTRSPLRQDPLPQAGDSAYAKARDIFDDYVAFWFAMMGGFLCLTLVQAVIWYTKRPLHPGYFAFVTLVVGIIGAFKIRSHIKEIRNYVQGAEGERTVGQLLEQTREKGYRVYHDIPCDGFNIDHVLIGPAGVFVIETKTPSKPTNGSATIKYDGEKVRLGNHEPDRDPIAQAKACRDHIANLLIKITNRRPKMRAVVLYPGWWVEKQPKGVEVWVLSPGAFVKFLARESTIYRTSNISLLAESLESCVRASRLV
ncbi:MAG TPA: nuclease-related domain-containing protein [Phycisphaerae bacterium]|nr:nuclease-related domain-containing protein [Phycisphaerae bacterium]